MGTNLGGWRRGCFSVPARCRRGPARAARTIAAQLGRPRGVAVVAGAVRARRLSDDLGEARAEGADARTADGEAGLGHADVAAAQQGLGAFDAPRHQVGVRRLPVRVAEAAAEVRGRHERGAGQGGDVERRSYSRSMRERARRRRRSSSRSTLLTGSRYRAPLRGRHGEHERRRSHALQIHPLVRRVQVAADRAVTRRRRLVVDHEGAGVGGAREGEELQRCAVHRRVRAAEDVEERLLAREREPFGLEAAPVDAGVDRGLEAGPHRRQVLARQRREAHFEHALLGNG